MSQNSKLKKFFSFFLRFGLSAALMVFLYFQIDVENTIEVLKTCNVSYILLALVIFFGLNGVLLLRWFIMIRGLNLKAPFSLVLRYFFIGLFGNLFLPSAIGGDIIKIYGLCKDSSEKPKVFASVLLDRLTGFAAVVLVAVVSYAFGYKLLNDNAILISILILGIVAVGITTVLFNEAAYSLFCKIFSMVPKLQKSVMQMHYDIALLKGNYTPIYKAVGLSIFSQIVLAFVFFLSAKALHQDIGMQYFLMFVPLICVAATVPSIGGLGVREAGTAYFLGKIGIASGIAVSISLLSFLYMVVVGLLGGVIYVTSLSSGRIQYNDSNAGLGSGNTEG